MSYQFFQRLPKPVIVLLMGGPGSGKGLLAKRLPQVNHLSIGEVLREMTQTANHPSHEYIRKQMQQGKLLEDREILQLLDQAEVFKHPTPILLDGFPRTLWQWSLFKERYGLPKAIIELEVSKEVMQQRLLGRGRPDDNEKTITYRIQDYFNNTKPTAKQILSESSLSVVINANTKTPEEVTDEVREFLKKENLYPTREFEYEHPSFSH